jgi:hypothetical protein
MGYAPKGSRLEGATRGRGLLVLWGLAVLLHLRHVNAVTIWSVRVINIGVGGEKTEIIVTILLILWYNGMRIARI